MTHNIPWQAILWPVLLITFFAAKNDPIATPPNIVFIAVDDLRPDLGCYGNALVHSPNIDQLAAEGVLFKKHYVQVPTCGPSRYSLLTGMRPKDTMSLKNNIMEKVLAPAPEMAKPESFIHHLRRNGYHTVGIGKLSHSPDGMVYGYEEEKSNRRELPHSWDELVFDHGKWGTGWNAFFGYANGQNRQSLKKQVKPYEAGKVDDFGYVDGLTAQLAIAKLTDLKQKKQPFFLGVGFFKPHLPFNAPEKYWNLYDRIKIEIAKDSLIPTNVNPKSLHDSFELNQYALTDEVAGLSGSLSTDYSKKLIHSYYAAISYVDAQIGLVLDHIKKLGLQDNTIVVLWGDHGWHLGNKRVWGKHTLFESALKSALIIKVPGNKAFNAESSSIVETVDIYPTLLDLCHIEPPHPIDGKSFKNQLTNPETIVNDTAFSYYNRGISMRTERYRITKYFREEKPTIELYDHATDPLESRNIAGESTEIVERLLPRLEKAYNGMYGR